MTKVSKLFVLAGVILILLAITLKIAGTHLLLGSKSIKLISLLVMANTSFILAILFKK